MEQDDNFHMESVSLDVSRLLAGAPPRLPLTEAELRPAVDACKLRVGDAPLLFPGAREPIAALAGLLLRTGCWKESHKVAQDIESAVSNYWHGILHRMEPDSANAKYWFRRVGSHAVFPQLLQQASEILKAVDLSIGQSRRFRIR